MTCIDHGQVGCKGGYSRVRFGGVVTGGHRRAYCQHNNVTLEDIAGLEVRHMCNNSRCINPEHLDIGTAKDNAQDRERTANHRRGTNNPAAVLVEADVRRIRQLYADGVKQVDIAKMYNTSQGRISNIITRRTWKCLA